MNEPMYMKVNETQSELGDRIILYYYARETDSAEFFRPTYGIGIDMYTQLPGERTLKERKFFESVFADKKDAIKMIDMLSDGCVTPMTLSDVLYDQLSCDAI